VGRKKLVRKTEPPSKRGIAWPRWTGFRGMTLRNWLELLVVPLALVGIGLLFEMQQADRQQATEKQQQALAEQRAQDEALQAYLNQMSQLMLERKLLEAEQGDPVHTLAQARTSTVILRLDAEHNESVIRFLSDTGTVLPNLSEPRGWLLRAFVASPNGLLLGAR
jgi:selenocysteine lyase/cysteine desulfurase